MSGSCDRLVLDGCQEHHRRDNGLRFDELMALRHAVAMMSCPDGNNEDRQQEVGENQSPVSSLANLMTANASCSLFGAVFMEPC